MQTINNRPVFIYDIETYPNVFTLDIKPVGGDHTTYEISEYRDDTNALAQCLQWLRNQNAYMVGFNNLGFDYPVTHLLTQGWVNYDLLYQKAQAIISAKTDQQRWSHQVWKPHISQIDLFKIHHFDNKARRTSLKQLEFAMRLSRIQDLPFTPGMRLTNGETRELVEYNKHDVDCTEQFYLESVDAIQMRVELSKAYGKDLMNFNDTKIGKDRLITQVCESLGGIHPKQLGQTQREWINLGDVILPYVDFNTYALCDVLNQFKATTIKGAETKAAFKLSANVDGFKFDYGTGGLHGSVDRKIFKTTDTHQIVDLDVASYYPSLAIVNGWYPQHLGEAFVHTYNSIKEERFKHKKGTAPNAALKLALNGAYGDSNNVHSPLLDPQFTMSITVNGQLLLTMLAEQCMKIPGLHMIQANTDGITVYCPKQYLPNLREICKWWEQLTKLELEEVLYSRMFIRDVNNYIAEYEDGKLKRKNAYNYKLQWHQNQSALVIPKIAEKVLTEGADPEELIYNWSDVYDFFYMAKVNRSSKLVLQSEHGDIGLQRISRYYVSREGLPLVKIMPPLATAPDKIRRIGIQAGKLVKIQNDVTFVDKIDYSHYLKEIAKLTEPLKEFRV